MNPRLYDRLSAALSVGILSALAAVSYYLVELSDQFARLERARPDGHQADYIVEGLALTRMNRDGAPLFKLSANRLTHYGDDDTSEFERPQMVSLDPDKPLVRLQADRGRTDGAGQVTHLHGNVQLTRAAQAEQPELRVQTDYAKVLTDREIALTDRPVTIQYGESSLTGVGMEFNNSTRVLDVLSDVRGTWVAQQHKR
jgi:lipopolysaccharide export system protein LptC